VPGVRGDVFGDYADGADGLVRVDGGSDFELAPDGSRAVYVNAGSSYIDPCTGRKCKCGALVGGASVALETLRVNIDGSTLCAMGVTETIAVARAQARLNGCFVSWNSNPPVDPPKVLDGITITHTAINKWEISTNDDGTAWLWSDGRRASRQDEGVSNIPFSVTVTAICGS